MCVNRIKKVLETRENIGEKKKTYFLLFKE
jgi:hypothetical protein